MTSWLKPKHVIERQRVKISIKIIEFVDNRVMLFVNCVVMRNRPDAVNDAKTILSVSHNNYDNVMLCNTIRTDFQFVIGTT